MSAPAGQGSEEGFGLGHLPSPEDPRDLVGEHRLGMSIGSEPFPASMLEHRVGRIWQGAAASCGPHALARAINMLHRARGVIDPPFPARRHIYFNARAQERREAAELGEVPGPLLDRGVYSRLLFRAAQRSGFCDEGFFPYSDDPQAIAETPSPAIAMSAIDQANLRYSRILSTGRDRLGAVSTALLQQKPVIFAMFVDSAFMRNKGELITSVDMSDPNGGGHMLTALEVTPAGHLLFDNWWGLFGNEDGLGLMSADLFGSLVVSEAFILEHVEALSTEAA